MPADATKMFSGPVSTLEISSNGSDWTDLGFGNANAEITWEPAQGEIMDGNNVQLSGLGKISLELVQTDDATLTVIKTYRTAKAYLRVTAVDGNTYMVNGIFLSYQLKRGFKAGEPHTIIVTGQRHTINPDDWCAFPS